MKVPPIKPREYHQKPVKGLKDTFRNSQGKSMTRRQLSNLVSKVNYKLKQAESYLSPAEFAKFQKAVRRGIAATGAYAKDTQYYTLKGITDPTKLRHIEIQARKALASHYMSHRRYVTTEEKRYQTFKDDYGFTRSEYSLLMKLFASDEWQKLRGQGVMDSDQILKLLRKNVFARGQRSDTVINALKDVMHNYDEAINGTTKVVLRKSKATDFWLDTGWAGEIVQTAPTLDVSNMSMEDVSKMIINDLVAVMKGGI